jgi:hypothetical protein
MVDHVLVMIALNIGIILLIPAKIIAPQINNGITTNVLVHLVHPGTTKPAEYVHPMQFLPQISPPVYATARFPTTYLPTTPVSNVIPSTIKY